MKLKSVKIEKITAEIKTKKGFIFLFAAAVVFSFVSYLTFFQPDPNSDEISEYARLFECGYDEKDTRISGASISIKSLIDDDQVKEMEYYGKLIEEKNYSNGRNPFAKPF